MKQVAVRMRPDLHETAIKAAVSVGETFGEFVRESVRQRLNLLAADHAELAEPATDHQKAASNALEERV